MPAGDGLPCALVNCLLVSRPGTVYCGTDAGLAHSGDGGHTWRFLRGADWRDQAAAQPDAQGDGAAEGLKDNAKVDGIEVLPAAPGEYPGLAIRTGGGAVGGFAADADFDGGDTSTVTKSVDTSGAPSPAPEAVYQGERFGSFTYTVPGLTPRGAYWVRLHFAETWFGEVGDRLFNVSINDVRVLDHFDILASAGGRDMAVTRTFLARADAQGRITLAFRGVKPLVAPRSPYELTEDYVTALGEDSMGRLWVGHRRADVEVLDEGTGARALPTSAALPQMDDAAAVLCRPGLPTLVGLYGGGVVPVSFPDAPPESTARRVAEWPPPPLPSPAPPPTLAQLNALLRTVSAVPPDPQELTPKVVALDDDWVTQGDWLGRYGRYWACLCAICSPQDYIWGAGWEPVDYASQIGPDVAPGDSLRYWVQWLYTKDPRVLELPPTYLDSRIKKGLTDGQSPRREAEQDDHGEAYPAAQDGPDIYETLTVPPGLYTLSLYEFNKDAHDPFGQNRFRDYPLSIRPHPARLPLNDLGTFAQQPEWAHGRVVDFWGGVWKRFLVRGPQTLTIAVDRNGSFNTLLQAVTLDLTDEAPPPYFGTLAAWRAGQARQQARRRSLIAAWRHGGSPALRPARTARAAADRLWDALERARLVNPVWWAVNGRRAYGPLLRWYGAQPTGPDLSARVATCDYMMGLYPRWEEAKRRQGLRTARDIEKALRWDGISEDGQGYQVVTAALAAAGRQAAARTDANRPARARER